MTAVFAVNWQSMPDASNRTMGLYVASNGIAIPISTESISQSVSFEMQASMF